MNQIQEKNITLLYTFIQKGKVIVLVTCITMFFVLSVFYLHPSNINWVSQDNFSITNLLQFIFIDQILIELITTYCIALAIGNYADFFKMNQLKISLSGLVLYGIKFLPLFLIAYFLFSPITTSIRYLYHCYILDRKTIDYFDSYFFLNGKLYLTYLVPIVSSGILLLSINIISTIRKIKLGNAKGGIKDLSLKVRTKQGERLISTKNISYIKKNGRKYIVKSRNEIYEINKNLSTLEKELDKNFIKVNRSTIINLVFFREYSFWENEKYILRMKDGEEFSVTRERLKSIKARIVFYNDNFDIG
ncbi:LytTR family DNA-binding domain-containing protein [Aquimarina algiphila]|uniref:LytTR family transcriptional regulator n=1 Tax=Aquimarina algiphila TaxID=2047982 RepID=A0A554VQL2_9FLAO|nr:LytTR family DNA-binding domain-containing protein [Aquimarina algiphila]TSE10827.1 LytTR family transcriptional regulator [Aquimarina algiphila]